MASAALDLSPVPVFRQTDASTPLGQSSASKTEIKSVESPEEGFGFADMLDILNPLQHIPLVNTLYRRATGDQEGAVADLVGGTLYGGLIGLGAAVVDLIVKDKTGSGVGDHMVGWLEDSTGTSSDTTPTMLAQQDATSASPPSPAVTATAVTAPPAPTMASPGARAPVATAALAPPPTAAVTASSGFAAGQPLPSFPPAAGVHTRLPVPDAASAPTMTMAAAAPVTAATGPSGASPPPATALSLTEPRFLPLPARLGPTAPPATPPPATSGPNAIPAYRRSGAPLPASASSSPIPLTSGEAALTAQAAAPTPAARAGSSENAAWFNAAFTAAMDKYDHAQRQQGAVP